MKEVRIKTLELSNWRAQDRRIDFSEITELQGRNKSGKSTVKDAVLWLLTGYDSEDRFNHQLFDTRKQYTQENSLPAYVEATFEIDNVEFVMKRSAKMGWVRKRNTDTYEKKATDDYSFFIDGVEVTSGDYTKFVETNFCSVQHLKFILNTSYYLLLEWKELRKVFSDIIGEIQMSDYDGDFSEIEEMLVKYGTLDAIKDMLTSRRRPLKAIVGNGTRENPGTLQTEIDALEENLPDISDVEANKRRAEEIRGRISELDALITGASESLAPMIRRRNEMQVEIVKAQGEIERARTEYESECYAKEREVSSQIAEAERKNNARQTLIRRDAAERAGLQTELASLKETLESLNGRREELLAKNKEVKARVFSDTKCSYCGQELPADMLEDARRKFNSETEREHSRIVAVGRANNDRIKSIKERMDAVQERLDSPAEIPDEIPTDGLRLQLEEIRSSRIPFEQTGKYRKMSENVEDMKSRLPEIPVAPDTGAYQAEKDRLSVELMECGKVIGREAEYGRMKATIKKKRDELARNIEELVSVEGLIAKAEAMEKQKMEIIRSRVKHLFDICDIEMEVRKKDGTMTPACNISVAGVPSSVLNSAAKTEAGIDISNAFCRHNEIWMPLIVDDMESIDSNKNINRYGRQEIRMRRVDCDLKVINI